MMKTGVNVMKFQVSFHPSGNFLASSSLDGSIKIFDLLEARPVFDLLGHEKPVTAVSFSPKTGSTIASGGKDSLVFLWQSNLKVPYVKKVISKGCVYASAQFLPPDGGTYVCILLVPGRELYMNQTLAELCMLSRVRILVKFHYSL